MAHSRTLDEKGPNVTDQSKALKLIVTGGAGYIGSVCTARLIEAGHEVTVVDDLSTGHGDAVHPQARFIEGDAAETAETLLGEGFDGVLHFAAKSLVGESMQDPAKYWHGNVITSIRLLDAMRKHGTPRLVFSSTATMSARGTPTSPASRSPKCSRLRTICRSSGDRSPLASGAGSSS